MQAIPDREATVHLQGGESLCVHLKAGTTIVSTAGRLELTGSPRWLGGEVFPARTTLAEGEAWLAEENGWLTVAAAQYGSSVSIFHINAPSRWSHVLRWLHGLRPAARLLTAGRAGRPCA